jgi:hypothetical protein
MHVRKSTMRVRCKTYRIPTLSKRNANHVDPTHSDWNLERAFIAVVPKKESIRKAPPRGIMAMARTFEWRKDRCLCVLNIIPRVASKDPNIKLAVQSIKSRPNQP